MLGLKRSNLSEPTKDIKTEGAAFLAVCRGKVIQAIPTTLDLMSTATYGLRTDVLNPFLHYEITCDMWAII